MHLPERFSSATFATYKIQVPGQVEALEEARSFTEYIKKRPAGLRQWARALFTRSAETDWKGLYLVGPVGTGKTHLLAAMYHALQPDVSCAFLHSSEFFRMSEHPEAFAQRLARSHQVLCLDEIELDDPANEARLIVALKALEASGVVLLATSNVEPEKFLSAEYGNDRFRRFLNEEFRKRYKVVFVGGDDYRRRLSKPGLAWIGDPDATRLAMRGAFETDHRHIHWMDFETFLSESVSTEHTRLVRRLMSYDALYLADVRIRDANDAMRLLRVVDDLYQAPAPPILYFTSEAPPDAWLRASDAHSKLEKGIAEKFARTTSRLYAMCEVEFIGPTSAVA